MAHLPSGVLKTFTFGGLFVIVFLVGCGGSGGGFSNDGTNASNSPDTKCTSPPKHVVNVRVLADKFEFHVDVVDANKNATLTSFRALTLSDLKKILGDVKNGNSIRLVELSVTASYNQLPVESLRKELEALGMPVKVVDMDEKER